MLDRQSHLTMVQSIAPAAHNATVNGAAVDTAGYNAATIYFLTGAITDGTHTPSIQDSPDGVTWTAVPAANLIPLSANGVLANLAANQSAKLGYVGTNRYLRAVSTVAGATTGGVYGAYVALQVGRHLPQAG